MRDVTYGLVVSGRMVSILSPLWPKSMSTQSSSITSGVSYHGNYEEIVITIKSIIKEEFVDHEIKI